MDRSADPTLFALLAIMGYHNRSAVGYSGLELGFDGLEGGVGSAERSTTVQESWIDGVIHCSLRKLDRRSDPLQFKEVGSASDPLQFKKVGSTE